jgi:hypothetical protein
MNRAPQSPKLTLLGDRAAAVLKKKLVATRRLRLFCERTMLHTTPKHVRCDESSTAIAHNVVLVSGRAAWILALQHRHAAVQRHDVASRADSGHMIVSTMSGRASKSTRLPNSSELALFAAAYHVVPDVIAAPPDQAAGTGTAARRCRAAPTRSSRRRGMSSPSSDRRSSRRIRRTSVIWSGSDAYTAAGRSWCESRPRPWAARSTASRAAAPSARSVQRRREPRQTAQQAHKHIAGRHAPQRPAQQQVPHRRLAHKHKQLRLGGAYQQLEAARRLKCARAPSMPCSTSRSARSAPMRRVSSHAPTAASSSTPTPPTPSGCSRATARFCASTANGASRPSPTARARAAPPRRLVTAGVTGSTVVVTTRGSCVLVVVGKPLMSRCVGARGVVDGEDRRS